MVIAVLTLLLCFLSNFLPVVCENYHTIEAKEYSLVTGLPNIYITSMTEKIGCTWAQGKVYDKSLIEKFYALLPVDTPCVIFDLGAQTGCFSLLAKYLPQSTWYAFEPIAEAVMELKANLLLNNIHNVQVCQTAVADFAGTVTLYLPAKAHWGLSTIGSNLIRFTAAIKREVDCITLDSFVAEHNIDKVHFVKIDTEGAELLILRGGKQMIMRDHPIILMEYNENNMQQCGVLRQDIDNFLKSMDYQWTMVSNEDILCIPSSIHKKE